MICHEHFFPHFKFPLDLFAVMQTITILRQGVPTVSSMLHNEAIKIEISVSLPVVGKDREVIIILRFIKLLLYSNAVLIKGINDYFQRFSWFR